MENHYEDNDLAYKSGVYLIWHIDRPERSYIGSTEDSFRSRWNKHLYLLKNDKHHSRKLQNTVYKFGVEGIRIVCLQDCPAKLARSLEQYWINTIQPWYNTMKKVGKRPISTYDIERRPIIKYSKKGLFISEYRSIRESARKHRIHSSGIDRVLDTNKLYKGFLWRSKEGDDFPHKIDVDIEERYSKRINKGIITTICQYSVKGEFIKEFSSYKDAEDATGISYVAGASHKKRKAGGYYWRLSKEVTVGGVIKKNIDIYRPGKDIICYNMDGEFLKVYKKRPKVVDSLGVSYHFTINKFEDESIVSHEGFVFFRYMKNYPKKINPYKRNNSPYIVVTDLKSNKIHTYTSLRDCVSNEDITTSAYYRCIKSNGVKFEYNGKKYQILYESYKPVPLFEVFKKITK